MGKALSVALVVVSLLAGACRPATELTEETVAGGGAESPEEAVELLIARLRQGDFEGAADVGMPDQAVLAALAEGATAAEVASALKDPAEAISANFWSGFAQGAGAALEGEVAIESAGTVTHEGIEFTLVNVEPEGGAPQVVMTRESNGHRVDIFASFAPVLAARLASPVELLLGSAAPDAGTVLSALQDVVPSLWAATSGGDLSPQATQEVLQLLELITRVG